jgi:hypothetical protein
LTKARSFRNAIRGYGEQPDPAFGPKEIDAIARSAHTASALVFLVVESTATYDVCAAVVSAMKGVQGFLPDFGSRPEVPEDDPWPELNDRMARLLREFQVAAREELGIGGVDPSWILDRNRPRDLWCGLHFASILLIGPGWEVRRAPIGPLTLEGPTWTMRGVPARWL